MSVGARELDNGAFLLEFSVDSVSHTRAPTEQARDHQTCAFLALLYSVQLSSLEAATVYVAAGGDLQAALNAARPGDTILLEEGAECLREMDTQHRLFRGQRVEQLEMPQDEHTKVIGERLRARYMNTCRR